MIVSDEPILDTVDKLERTDKVLCLPLKEDADMFFHYQSLRKFGKGSYESKILAKITAQKIPCCLYDYTSKMEALLDKPFFVVYVEEVLKFFLKMFNPVFQKNVFINDKPFSSTIVFYHLSKKMNKRTKAEFNRQVAIYLENGYKFKLVREVDQALDQHFAQVKLTFRNAGQYINHFTMISNVEMNDFTFVYLFYIVWSLFLLCLVLQRFKRSLLCFGQTIFRLALLWRRAHHKLFIRKNKN